MRLGAVLSLVPRQSGHVGEQSREGPARAKTPRPGSRSALPEAPGTRRSVRWHRLRAACRGRGTAAGNRFVVSVEGGPELGKDVAALRDVAVNRQQVPFVPERHDESRLPRVANGCAGKRERTSPQQPDERSPPGRGGGSRAVKGRQGFTDGDLGPVHTHSSAVPRAITLRNAAVSSMASTLAGSRLSARVTISDPSARSPRTPNARASSSNASVFAGRSATDRSACRMTWSGLARFSKSALASNR